METIVISPYDSPVGRLIVGALGGSLCLCDWSDDGRHPRPAVERRLTARIGARIEEGLSPVIDMACRQLDEYFAGRRGTFEIPLLLAGTDFQLTVWRRLAAIPMATTVTYRDLSAAIGRPTAVRAVAAACGANAISVIIPCHRVTGADGSLTGYAGGIDAKRRLLELEQHSTAAYQPAK